jgi:hypothetical protein
VEMDRCFSEGSNIVLNCFSFLDPNNSFSKFDVDLISLLVLLIFIIQTFLMLTVEQ